jgi:hypothetical protein
MQQIIAAFRSRFKSAHHHIGCSSLASIYPESYRRVTVAVRRGLNFVILIPLAGNKNI